MLSDTEADALNTAVARAMGWEIATFTDGLSRAYWQPPFPVPLNLLGDFPQISACLLPDFCRENHALGWMVEWADKQRLSYTLNTSDGCHHLCFWGKNRLRWRQGYFADGAGETLGEALAMAISHYANLLAEGQKEGAV